MQNRPAGIVFLGMVRTAPDKRDHAAIAQAVADTGRAYAMIADKLAWTPYICGDTLTLADIAWGIHVHRWFTMDIQRPDMPALRAWYDRLCERPAYQQHVVACPIT